METAFLNVLHPTNRGDGGTGPLFWIRIKNVLSFSEYVLFLDGNVLFSYTKYWRKVVKQMF